MPNRKCLKRKGRNKRPKKWKGRMRAWR
jgi:hypothetical protein